MSPLPQILLRPFVEDADRPATRAGEGAATNARLAAALARIDDLEAKIQRLEGHGGDIHTEAERQHYGAKMRQKLAIRGAQEPRTREWGP